jgi:hypothetical protein
MLPIGVGQTQGLAVKGIPCHYLNNSLQIKHLRNNHWVASQVKNSKVGNSCELVKDGLIWGRIRTAERGWAGYSGW